MHGVIAGILRRQVRKRLNLSGDGGGGGGGCKFFKLKRVGSYHTLVAFLFQERNSQHTWPSCSKSPI